MRLKNTAKSRVFGTHCFLHGRKKYPKSTVSGFALQNPCIEKSTQKQLFPALHGSAVHQKNNEINRFRFTWHNLSRNERKEVKREEFVVSVSCLGLGLAAVSRLAGFDAALRGGVETRSVGLRQFSCLRMGLAAELNFNLNMKRLWFQDRTLPNT